MKYLLTSLSEFRKKLHTTNGCLLMLDFDGTLSPLVKTPDRAFFSPKNKRVLQNLNRLIPIVVISGRSLVDIKNKVGIKGCIYVGNHGLEWQIGEKRGAVNIPADMVTAMALVRKRLQRLIRDYPGALLENKGLAVSLHYRLVKRSAVRKLVAEAHHVFKPFQTQRLLTIVAGKKVLDVLPAVRWNKGYSAAFFHRRMGLSLVPIYIGDDSTDEDVFKMLKNGITVVVGKHKGSRAKYFCHTTSQVSRFLNWLLRELRSRRVQYVRSA